MNNGVMQLSARLEEAAEKQAESERKMQETHRRHLQDIAQQHRTELQRLAEEHEDALHWLDDKHRHDLGQHEDRSAP